MGFAPTWLRQVSPSPLLHKTTLTTGVQQSRMLFDVRAIGPRGDIQMDNFGNWELWKDINPPYPLVYARATDI